MDFQTRYKTEVTGEMEKLENELMSEGISRYQAHIKIGEKFGLTRASIYRLLTPHILERDRDRSREYQKNYSHRQEIIQRHKNWNRKYMRLWNHVDNVLEEIFGFDHSFSIENATNKIVLKTGIKMRPGTILNRLQKKFEKYGISPIFNTEGKEYILDSQYFSESRKK